MELPEPSVRCPRCRYRLADPLPACCPECGWRVDLAELFGDRPTPIPKVTVPIILVGMFGGPALFVLAVGLGALGAPTGMMAVLFPYAELLVRLLPSDAAALGVAVGVLQGPLYGFVLGLALPIARYREVWTVVALAHVLCAAVALGV